MKNKKLLYAIITYLIIGVNLKILSQEKNISIIVKRNNDKSVDISYTKKVPGSYYLKLELINLTNSYSNGYNGVINSYRGNLLHLKPINNKSSINFSYTFSYTMGNNKAKIDSLFTYTLPIKKGMNVKIYEASFLGERYFGSEKPLNWKSYAIRSKEPDTIFAMRKGIVVKIVDDFEGNSSPEIAYTSKRNYIVVEHEDGSYASYKGLNKNTLYVKLGQTVYPHSKIGILENFGGDYYKLDFSIYQLHFTDINRKNQTLKSQNSGLKYITPYFLTNKGVVILENNNEYISELNETILFEEFSKREIKKYLKNPNDFK